MLQADSVSAQMAVIVAGQSAVLTQALGQCFADGVASVPSATGDVTPAQELLDIAAAVKAAVDPLNATITQMGVDKAKEDALLAAVKQAAAALVAQLG